jgi:hypothetical protein
MSDLSATSASSADDPFAPPPNSSFESARALTAGEAAMQRVVDATQVDYYSFEARAGVFYVLSTDVSSFAPNNVISVFNSERALIAENDDGSLYPNDHIDARVIVRPEHSGTYYVTVEDRVMPEPDAATHLVPPLFYSLRLQEITRDTAGYAIETKDDSPSPLMLLPAANTKNRYITLLGELSDDDKQDSVEIQGLPDCALIGKLLPAGVKGNGSTASTVSVRVTADSDGHLLARCGLAGAQTNIHPPVDDAKYRIEITAGDQIGSNGFYAIDLVLLPDNPHEQADADNNSIGAAEPLMLSGTGSHRGLLLSRLPAKDVDYYRFSAQAGELVTVNCEGESGGSGVRGLQGELLGPTMQPLVSAREDSAKPLWIKPIELKQTGTYYLKLASETPAVQDANTAVEPWARCAVVVGH